MAKLSFSCAAVALVALLAVALLAVTLPAPAPASRQDERPSAPSAIEIDAQPVPSFDHRDPDRRRFGMLDFRGGLVLTSPFREFGGVSSISVAPDGMTFVAATDRSWWLRGRITYNGTRPTGITDAEMAPMLGSDGRTLASRRWYDTEAMARAGGTIYVGIERVHRIVRFDYGKNGLLARARPIKVPPAFRSFPNNGSVEALAFVPPGSPLGGTLIAIAERGRDRAGNHLAYLIGGPRPGAFAIKRRNDYDVSDATILPGGDLVVLERKFGWTTGLFIRIRRIPIAEVRPGALVDGAVLIEADLGQQVDNMEGISAHRSSTGETVLTLTSDNNFSPLQRTMLLQFSLAEE
ncbi:MAG: twin-arginine translocation pathway signal [Rhizobiales bacterium]|nr:twin-arginine translocation pathway signal [Hyphomicrobiales bacterium]